MLEVPVQAELTQLVEMPSSVRLTHYLSGTTTKKPWDAPSGIYRKRRNTETQVPRSFPPLRLKVKASFEFTATVNARPN